MAYRFKGLAQLLSVYRARTLADLAADASTTTCLLENSLLPGAAHLTFRAYAQPASVHMDHSSDHRTEAARIQQVALEWSKPDLSAAVPNPAPAGVRKTFYKRKLPCPPATEFSSAEGTDCQPLLIAQTAE